MSRRDRISEAQAGLIVAGLGAVAGVIAAAATSRFQTAWGRARLPPTSQGPGAPSPTESLAKAFCVVATGHPLATREVGRAGVLIHYIMGAALGAAYGLLSRYTPEVTAGRGAIYSLGVWATVEECGLALLGLKPPPWETEPAEHVFAATSHLVFGLSLDAALNAVAPKDPST